MRAERRKTLHILLMSAVLTLFLCSAAQADMLSRKKATVYQKDSVTLQLLTDRMGTVKWSASKKGIVKLKKKGTTCVVTGKKVGSVKVTAKFGKKKYTCKIKVKKLPQYQVKACPFGKTSSLGDVVQVYDEFYVAVRCNRGRMKRKGWKWSSSDPSMIQFTSTSTGGVTYCVKIGGKTGNVKVTARNGKKKVSLTLTVVRRSDPVYTVGCKEYSDNGGTELNHAAKTDHTFFAYVTSKYTSVPEGGWTWTSSNPGVVRVKQVENRYAHLETPGGIGTATITATRGEYSNSYTIRVTKSSERTFWDNYKGYLWSWIGLSNAQSQRYKSKLIAEWICSIAHYVITDSSDHFALLDTWLNNGRQSNAGYGQCMHYAYLYKYLAEMAGMPTNYVNATGANHAWNQTRVDNVWYNVDVTNMDQDDYGYINYSKQFLVSDACYIQGKGSKGYLYNIGKAGHTSCTSTTYDYWSNTTWRNLAS